MYGKGAGGPTNSGATNFFSPLMPWEDIIAASLFNPSMPPPSQTATDLMNQGRPSFNWSMMGALAPLAGYVPQPEYRRPPPDPILTNWLDSGPYRLSGGNIKR